MKYLIECSFGEIIDKITILKIKLNNVKNKNAKNNIKNEYNKLKQYLLINDNNFNNLFLQLSVINNILWILEDIIRDKSNKKIYDNLFVATAELIHKSNDFRYLIKNNLNEKYNSNIKEEKIYDNNFSFSILSNNELNNNYELDELLFNYAIEYYTKNDYFISEKIFYQLCRKYETQPINTFIIELFISYNINCNTINKKNIFINILDNNNFYNSILMLDLSYKEKEVHYKMMYGLYLLENKKYLLSEDFIKYLNSVYVSGIMNLNPNNMSFFNKNDTNKTLLIYTSGGLGDIIMFSRFIKKLCESKYLFENKKNKIIFLINDKLYWIFDIYLKKINNINNLELIEYSKRSSLIHFDYHINLHMLFIKLKLDYSKIFVDYYLEDVYKYIKLNNYNKFSYTILENIIQKDKLNICFNWNGNKNNINWKTRNTNINTFEKLFSIPNINWINIQKEVSKEEEEFMNKFDNIIDLHKKIDNNNNQAFYDTIIILKEVGFLISTDTSLIHIAGTLNIRNCWTLLSVNCDWRWTKDNNTNWYPNIKLIRQTKLFDWDDVILKVKEDLLQLLEQKQDNNNLLISI